MFAGLSSDVCLSICLHFHCCSLANNPGLCGVGIGPCSKMSVGEKFGLYISLAIGLSCMAAGAFYCWKKKIAITRGAQRLRKYSTVGLLDWDLSFKNLLQEWVPFYYKNDQIRVFSLQLETHLTQRLARRLCVTSRWLGQRFQIISVDPRLLITKLLL